VKIEAMGKKRDKKSKGRQPKVAKPPYYSSKRVTIGMLEDYCKAIKDKTAPVMLADSVATGPTKTLRGFVLQRGGTANGLVLCGDWRWAENGDEDLEDEDSEGDVNRNFYDDDDAWEHYGRSCGISQIKEVGDCVEVDGVRVQYLPEEEGENASPDESAKDVQQPKV
jgi:hypothetical protein